MVTEVKTEELILEWCGFEYGKFDFVSGLSSELNFVDEGWLSPEASEEPYSSEHFSKAPPTLDMNFFFKYVVPKLNRFTIDDTNRFENEWQKAFIVKLKLPHSKPVSAMAKDPNKAWQESLLKLISS